MLLALLLKAFFLLKLCVQRKKAKLSLLSRYVCSSPECCCSKTFLACKYTNRFIYIDLQKFDNGEELECCRLREHQTENKNRKTPIDGYNDMMFSVIFNMRDMACLPYFLHRRIIKSI